MPRGRFTPLLALVAACGAAPPPPPAYPSTLPEVPASGAVAATPPETPPALTFYETQDSSAWVAHNFEIQTKYGRVIAVYTGDEPPSAVTVSKLDLETPAGAAQTEELPVGLAVKTLEEAAEQSRGGDLVAVLPGRYAGFRLGDKADASDGHYIHFKALGRPGDVIVDRPCPDDPNWMILLQGAHHVIVQGFDIAGAATNTPGGTDLRGPAAGILINGDFVHTSKLAHHIAILGNYSHHHRVWGIHSVDSHTVLVQDNLFASSGKEHAAYFSDGSDDYVIRRNVFFASNACGLQVNLDPQASLEKVAGHGAIRYPPMQPSRAWALGLLELATKQFGANAFPDGRGLNYIIEDNVINGNGRIGGAGINLASVRASLIQNNLIYGNGSAGIAEWDNGNVFDAAAVKPGPRTAGEVTGEDALPLFGCVGNVVRNNTVLSAVKGRAALLVGNGSWGTRAYDNVLVNDELPSVELLNTSIWRFEASHNVVDRVSYEGPAAAMKGLAISLPDDPSSTTGVTRQSLAPSFVRAGDEPWVVLEGNWWRLNPGRPDFHPRSGVGLLAGRGDARNEPPTDLDGRRRTKPDIGAFVAVP
ncbi:MAG TPA: right-handed parallel beta-helix repeat-containing protein [Polyangiaceae bacterium]|jgi:hypothetical protein